MTIINDANESLHQVSISDHLAQRALAQAPVLWATLQSVYVVCVTFTDLQQRMLPGETIRISE